MTFDLWPDYQGHVKRNLRFVPFQRLKLANFGIFAGDMNMGRCCEVISMFYTGIVTFSRTTEVIQGHWLLITSYAIFRGFVPTMGNLMCWFLIWHPFFMDMCRNRVNGVMIYPPKNDNFYHFLFWPCQPPLCRENGEWRVPARVNSRSGAQNFRVGPCGAHFGKREPLSRCMAPVVHDEARSGLQGSNSEFFCASTHLTGRQECPRSLMGPFGKPDLFAHST